MKQKKVMDTKTFEEVFFREKHKKFVEALDKKTDTFEYYVMEHLRMSGVYWAIMAMDLMDGLESLDQQKIVEWVISCWQPNGGFSGNVGHDAHLLYTLSAIQILVIFDELDKIDIDKVTKYVSDLQQSDGSFIGDEWGEIDTRFSYCALCCLDLLGKLNDTIDLEKAIAFIYRCRNFDGGFGAVPGAETHSGQIFCCVAALAIARGANAFDDDRDVLAWWLCERQLPTGGLNGRPEKKQDVCYSWWVLSSLSILQRIDWIDKLKLGEFILSCQDKEDGGLSDRAGNMADVFHTYFGIAGLSLLGYPNLNSIDPVYALPKRTVERLQKPILYDL